MADASLNRSVLQLLSNFRGPEPLKQLFWSELNYDQVSQNLSRKGWGKGAANALAEDPLLMATAGDGAQFHVVYCRLAADRLRQTDERAVASRLIRDHPYALLVFSDNPQRNWHFLNVKYEEGAEKRKQFRRITIGPDERLRTATERISLLDVEAIGRQAARLGPLEIQSQHDLAFDVETVTKQFFEDYKAIFSALQDDLAQQVGDEGWAHDYALQILNRLMFLYFLQRKKWLGKDREFLANFWGAYCATKQPKDTFFSKWLGVLFFQAFNRKFHGGHRHFPQKIRDSLSVMPFLNGGLFTENDLDKRRGFNITDDRFRKIFDFLESYNFTIAENSPLDQEVAVDPEMIGKVYESLVNVSTEADERGDAGIFYTPRTEIDLMCRLALVDRLTNNLGVNHKNLLYEALFAYEQDEKDSADKAINDAKLWPVLDELLRNLTIADPACGSGSFLVGMLQVLDDLTARAEKQIGRADTAYERRKRIIGRNLYGVDVMDWAVHVAELRLWLALIVDAQFTLEELHLRHDPLLPHLSFNLRIGDSLVEEIAGINLSHLHGLHGVSAPLKTRITKLKGEKLKFYNSDPSCKYRTAIDIKRAEKQLFLDILSDRHHAISSEIATLQNKMESRRGEQINIAGILPDEPRQFDLRRIEYKEKIEALQPDLDQIIGAREALTAAKEVPFVWDIAFVEIFSGGNDGFDIVIGNPPYVRQESIADPQLLKTAINKENKKAYKAKLARSVYQSFPTFFGYKVSSQRVSRKLPAKSDLYVYFYFHGLRLLNRNGAFCFITSNSWLDVGYGATLQEFLLKHSQIRLVLDNQAERSFDTAEVNTVIVLLSPVDERHDWGLDQTARFVMATVPYEHILSAVIFEEIDSTTDRVLRPEFRVFPVSQEKLLLDGLGQEENEIEAESSEAEKQKSLLENRSYIGNRWGGKFLRAPEVYWKLLEAGHNKLSRLGDIADVRFGIKSGANVFFHLDNEQKKKWKIEKQFLRKLVKSPRDYYSIRIDDSDTWLFWCQEEREELSKTNALKYIQWGESQGYDKTPSCQSRRLWYSVNGPKKPVLLWPSAFFERHIVYQCPKGYLADKVFYTISGDVPLGVQIFLNSSLTSLFVEVEGYQLNHGGIFVTTEWLNNMQVLNFDACHLRDTYQYLSERRILLCEDEQAMKDRRVLDKSVLKELGCSGSEILEELYNATRTYVRNRILRTGRNVTSRGRGIVPNS